MVSPSNHEVGPAGELPITPTPATYRYSLTWADALAYENLRAELPGVQRVLFFMWLALAGAVLASLPEQIAGASWSLQFYVVGFLLIGVQYALFVIARTVLRYVRARRRIPAPVQVELAEIAGELQLTENGVPRTVRFEDIGMLLPAATHLFMAVGRDLIIVPQAAFDDAEGIAAMANRIDGYMHERHASDVDDVEIEPPQEETPGDV